MSKVATVWSRDNCAYCDMAINYLNNKGYTVSIKKVGSNTTIEDLLKHVPNAKTLPQIFIGDQYIGNYNDLVNSIC